MILPFSKLDEQESNPRKLILIHVIACFLRPSVAVAFQTSHTRCYDCKILLYPVVSYWKTENQINYSLRRRLQPNMIWSFLVRANRELTSKIRFLEFAVCPMGNVICSPFSKFLFRNKDLIFFCSTGKFLGVTPKPTRFILSVNSYLILEIGNFYYEIIDNDNRAANVSFLVWKPKRILPHFFAIEEKRVSFILLYDVRLQCRALWIRLNNRDSEYRGILWGLWGFVSLRSEGVCEDGYSWKQGILSK